MGDHSKNPDGKRHDGKHSGGNGNTMKKGGDWDGRGNKGGSKDKTEEIPKGTDGGKRG